MEDAVDLHLQRGVACRPRRGWSALRRVVGRRGDLATVPVQHPADRLDPEPVPMIINEGDHHGSRGSSSRAKKRSISPWRCIADSTDAPPTRHLTSPRAPTAHLITKQAGGVKALVASQKTGRECAVRATCRQTITHNPP